MLFAVCGNSIIKADDRHKIDSLLQVLKQDLSDSVRIKTLEELAWQARNESYETAVTACKEGIALARKHKNYVKEATFHRFKGVSHSHFGEHDKALSSYITSLNISRKINYQEGIGFCYDNIGVLKYFQKDFEEARINFEQALEVFEKHDIKQGIGYACTHLSWVYNEIGDYDKALEYARKALDVRMNLDSKINIANTMRDLGNIYKRKQDWASSLKYYESAQNYVDTTKNLTAYVEFNYETADLFYRKKDIISAIRIAEYILPFAERLKNKRFIMKITTVLNNAYIEKRDFAQAHKYLTLYTVAKDSILTEEKEKEIARLFENLNLQKKEQENEYLKESNEMQKKYISGLFLLLLLAFVLLLFVLRYNRKVERINRLLKSKNDEIIMQSIQIREFADMVKNANDEIQRINTELNAKNADFTDSINYARSIQAVILSVPAAVDAVLPQKFIYFKPKDIVSGDFYYFHEYNNQLIVAVADCTGHGVPGAFMSMIGNEILNEIVINRYIHDPQIILTEMNKSIRSALKQDVTQNRDGLDIALCTIDFNEKIVFYSGAKIPLYVFIKPKSTNTEPIFHQISPTKRSIGGEEYGSQKPFEKHEIHLEEGLMLSFYMATDGYTDQFGGEKGKKFMVKRFKDLLEEAQNIPFEEQEKFFAEKIETWKGKNEQVDDMTILGFRIVV